MLTLIIEEDEFFDEANSSFVKMDKIVLELEHSLVSLSKWESRFCKPFLGNGEKTREETIAYIECMVLSGNFSMDIYNRLKPSHLDQINEYISSEQSATTFVDLQGSKAGSRNMIITSELIYYWMVSYTVPFECENWHLNRLFALLRICNVKSGNQKKMSKNEIATRNRELNAQRKAQLNTTG